MSEALNLNCVHHPPATTTIADFRKLLQGHRLCTCPQYSLLFEQFKLLQYFECFIHDPQLVSVQDLVYVFKIADGILQDYSPSGLCMASRTEFIVKQLLENMPNRLLIPALVSQSIGKYRFKRWLYYCLAEFNDGVQVFIEGFNENKGDLADQIAAIIMQGGKVFNPSYYFPRIFQQLRTLCSYVLPNSGGNSEYFELVQKILRRIWISFPKLFQQFIMNPVLESFNNEDVELTESQFTAILNLVQNLTTGIIGKYVQENDSIFTSLFESSFLFLLHSLHFAQKAKSLQRKQIEYVLRCLLEFDTDLAKLKCALDKMSNGLIIKRFLKIGSNGGILVEKNLSKGETNIVDTEHLSKCISEFLHENLVQLKFISIVLYISEKVSLNPLQVSELIPLIMENCLSFLFSEQITTSPLEAVELFDSVLWQSKSDSVISLSLALITSILSQGAINRAEVKEFGKQKLVPTLRSKFLHHSNPDISQPASLILQVFEDQPIVNPSVREDQKQFIHDLSSPDDMTRAYALKQLGEYLKMHKWDEIDDENMTILYGFVEKHVHDPETFISGFAIKTLVSLVEIQPDKAVPSIVAKYSSLSLPDQTRVKLAEAISQVIQNFGLTIYKYKPILIRSLLNSIQPNGSNTPTIRKSAFSALSDCLQALKFGVHEYITEIVDVILCALSELEEDWEVKNSAVYLSIRLIENAGKVMLSKHQHLVQELYGALENISRQVSFLDSETLRVNIETGIHEIRLTIESLIQSEVYLPIMQINP